MDKNKYDMSDIVNYSAQGNPLQVKATLDNLMLNKIHAEIESKKLELAKTMFGGVPDEDESEEDFEDDFEDEEEDEDDDALDISDEDIEDLLNDLDDIDLEDDFEDDETEEELEDE